MAAAEGSATRALAGFAAGLELASVPADLVAKLKLHLMDAIGCALAGAPTDLAVAQSTHAASVYAGGPCPVIGTGCALGPVGAAFANAAAMNALDFDDGFEVEGRGMGHPGATLAAAALAAPWIAPVDGRAFLAALAAAYEVNARVILSMQPSHERFRAVYGVCQHQALGAAAAFGRLLGLDAAGLENALGFAGTLAPVPSLRKYNWQARPLVSFKDFNAPAAEAGVRAVLLDRAGLVGARDVLDGDSGFWRMMGSDRCDAAILTDGLGERWLARHASFKPYPTCRWMHAVLESFEAVRDVNGLAADEIEHVVVLTSAGMVRDFMDPAPATMVDAEFSLPFALASLALADRPMPFWYEADALVDPRRRGFAARVGVEVDAEFDAAMSGPARRPGGAVRIVARGAVFEGPRLALPRGAAERPMSEAEIVAKFRLNAGRTVSDAVVERLCAALLGIDGAPDVAAALAPLAGFPAAAAPGSSHLRRG